MIKCYGLALDFEANVPQLVSPGSFAWPFTFRSERAAWVRAMTVKLYWHTHPTILTEGSSSKFCMQHVAVDLHHCRQRGCGADAASPVGSSRNLGICFGCLAIARIFFVKETMEFPTSAN